MRLLFAPLFLALALCRLLFAAAPVQATPHAALSVGPAPGWIEPPLDPLIPVVLQEEPASHLDYLVNERQELTPSRAAYVHIATR